MNESTPDTTIATCEVMPQATEADAAAAHAISQAYAAANSAVLTSVRMVIVCGLLMMEQKRRCKRGQFGPWLQLNCPEICWRTAQRWLDLTTNVLSFLGMLSSDRFFIPDEIRHCVAFRTGVEKTPTGEVSLATVLQLPAEILPEQARSAQEKVFQLIGGKSQRQLMFEFRDLDPKPRTYHPPKAGLEQRRAEKNRTMHEEAVTLLIQRIHFIIESGALAFVTDAIREDLRRAQLALGRHIADISSTSGRRRASSPTCPTFQEQ